MLAPENHSLSHSEKNVVLVCRDPRRRALLERIVPSAEAHASAIEAMLAVARKGPRAVIVNFEDVEGSERDVMAAVQRARPEVPVYFVVEPEDEPAARRARPGRGGRLLRSAHRRVSAAARAQSAAGAAGRNPSSPERKRGAHSAAASDPDLTVGARTDTTRERPDQLRLFVSACALADLAQSDPQTILHEGTAIVLHALDATRGCLLSWDSRTESLDLLTAMGETSATSAEQFAAEQAGAEQALHANAAVLTEAGASGRAILCVPVCHDDEVFAILCISGKRGDAAMDSDDRDAAARLVSVIGQLYGAAVRLARFAAMSLRDAETGLLKAEALETYLTKLIGRASAHNAPVTVILLQPEAGDNPSDAVAIARMGRSIAARLPHGWQGARLDGNRFAVVGAPKPDTQPLPQEVALLLAARSQGVVDLGGAASSRLQAGLAEFPKDGADARTLLAAAAGRLGEP